ncbi:fungal-specific transcription factor domain-containing protein [Lyophyllum atratum]|nr:fungal-specific transcription factor domain-containing protein [Lyophyllum atratum]
MSDTTASRAGASKKRRLPGACDICRKRKIKCDSGEMPGNKCSHCITFTFECTRTPRKNELASQKEYIKYLEDRVADLEALLRDTQTSEVSDSHRDSIPRSKVSYPELAFSTPRPPQHSGSTANDFVHSSYVGDTDDDDDDDDLGHIALAKHFSHLDLKAVEGRFFGQSSAYMLTKHAMMAKEQILGPAERSTGEEFRRPTYWDLRPWEHALMRSDLPNYIFPQADLLKTLVAAYFDNVNTHMPLLHRQTFEKSMAEDLHYLNPSFGATVLLVCAVGSRHVNDSRVFAPGDNSQLSAGWSYFVQVPIFRNYTLHKASLYDLQYYCLGAFYLHGTSVPNASWTFLGLGIHFAQEQGTHRRKAEGQKLTVEDELWKRAFWFLICWDRFSSAFLGRPLSIQDEEFDIDSLVECDDEYWEYGVNSELTFKQPVNKPSYVTAFNCCLSLCEILSFSMRTLYSTKKAKLWSGHVGNDWRHRLVAQMDSALNKWSDSVPDHVKWDPHRENALFSDQSTALYLVFYYVQMQIHRPFIQKDSPTSYASLAICTNAARACGHVLDIQFKRRILSLPHVIISAFTAGVILLLSTWSGRNLKEVDPHDDIAVLQSCLRTLKALEPTWHVAGRLWDMLNELANVRIPQPPKPLAASKKRQRDSVQPVPEPHAGILSAQMDTTSSAKSNRALGPSDNIQLSRTSDLGLRPLSSNAEQIHDSYPVARVDGHDEPSLPYGASFTADHSDITHSMGMVMGRNVEGPSSTEKPDVVAPYQSIDRVALSMWTNAPTGFDVAEWDMFIANMGGMNRN